MTRLANTFEGGSDETTITTGNSGGTSGDAFDRIFLSTGSIVFDDARAAVGSFSARVSTGGSAGTPHFDWQGSGSWQSGTDTFLRFYLYKTANPPAHQSIVRLENSGAFCGDIQIRVGGELALRDSAFTARFISTGTSIPSNEWVRIEIHYVHDTTNGHMEAKAFWGANLHDVTADLAIGNLTGNYNTGAAGTDAFVGFNTSVADYSLWFDEVAIDDTDWIGAAEVDTPLETPANLAVVETEDTIEATATWDAVSGADHYELAVEVSDGAGGWDPLITVDPATSPTVLDDGDGLDWGGSYQARVRAMPAAE